jgi:UDP-glucose 4-epimerase
MHTLITGGAGFIGSHLAEYLLADGDHVTVLDDLSTGRRENISDLETHPRFEFIEGCILDRKLVNDLVRRKDRVFHLAAAVGVRRIIEQPLDSLHVNLHGSENVMKAIINEQPDATMVLASTSEVYGLNDSDSLNEDSPRIYGSPLVSRWSYAEAKALDEAFAHAYWRERGLKVTISRFFNTTGPRQTGRYGMVVPHLIGQALRGEDLTVFGDGRQTRSFGYVGDVIPALVRLSESGTPVLGQAFNMGGEREVSILDLAQRIIELVGTPASAVKLVPYAEAYGEGYADMRRRVPDNTKAKRVLGFDPKTGLDAIIYAVASDLRERVHVSA